MDTIPTQPVTTDHLVVAIDGPGSSGKSTVGAAAAQALGYRFFDTGLLYRAVTWLAEQRGVPDDDVQGLVALVGEIELGQDAEGRVSRLLVAGREIGGELHGPSVDARVSAIAGIPEVRDALVDRQRSIAAPGAILMAGRDIGTVILPSADVKIYLDASVEERARRRAEERGLDVASDEFAALLGSLRLRDAQDASRPVAPLRRADDAVVLHTDGNSLEQTVAQVVETIRATPARPSAPGAPGAPGDAPRPMAAQDRGPEPAPAPAPRTPLPPTPIVARFSLLLHACTLLARVVTACVTRVRIEGDLSLIPKSGPMILIANHTSSADPVVVGGLIAPRIGRPLNWLAKKEVLDIPIVGFLGLRGGLHAIERSAVDVEAFRIAQRILDAGCVLAVFPEGTRSRTGALQEVKDGMALLAQRSGAPVVPIAIVGADKVWPKGQKYPRIGGQIIIRVGTPFTLTAEAGASRQVTARREAKGAATRRMMGAIAAMLPPRQRGVYADAVPAAAPAAAPAAPAVEPSSPAAPPSPQAPA